MKPLTDKDLDELERLDRAATPGPWVWEKSYQMSAFIHPDDASDPDGEPEYETVEHWAIKDPANAAAGRVTTTNLVSMSTGKPHGDFGFLDDPDVLVVPAARNALPGLLRLARIGQGLLDAAETDATADHLVNRVLGLGFEPAEHRLANAIAAYRAATAPAAGD